MNRLTNVNVGAGSSRESVSYKFTGPGYLTKKTYRNDVGAQHAYDSIGRLTGLTNRSASAILETDDCRNGAE